MTKKHIYFFIPFIVLVVTNPKENTYKSFLKGQGYINKALNHYGYGRIKNYYLFSFYSVNSKYEYKKHLGILGNFIEIEKGAKKLKNSFS